MNTFHGVCKGWQLRQCFPFDAPTVIATLFEKTSRISKKEKEKIVFLSAAIAPFFSSIIILTNHGQTTTTMTLSLLVHFPIKGSESEQRAKGIRQSKGSKRAMDATFD